MPPSQLDFGVSLMEHPTVWEIQNEVEKLQRSLPAVRGVLFLTIEGGALGCSFSEVDGALEEITNVAAEAANFGRLMSEGFFCGAMVEVTLRGSLGDLLLYSVGESGVLAFFTANQTELSAIHFEGRWASQKLADVIAKNKRLYGH